MGQCRAGMEWGCAYRSHRDLSSVPPASTYLWAAKTLQAAAQLWEAIASGKAEKDTALMNPCILLANCDLKHSTYVYWFGAPAFQLPTGTRVVERAASLASSLGAELAEQVSW